MITVFANGLDHTKNSIPMGLGRLLEPIVLYIRDDIMRPNIGVFTHKIYMSFLLTVFFLYMVC